MPLIYSEFFVLSNLDAGYFKRNYLAGFEFYGVDEQPLSDDFYEERLQNALATLEEATGVDVLERINVAEKHDHHSQEYDNFGYLKLFRVPARTVTGIRAVYATGGSVTVFPAEWVRLQVEGGVVHLVPTNNTFPNVIIGITPFYSFFGNRSYFPQLWEVDYVSGFEEDKIPRMIVDAIAKLAALDLLAVLSNFVHPIGVSGQSLSIDGLSQSRSFNIPAFKAQIDRYRADLYGQPGLGGGLIQQIRDSYRGVPIRGV